MRRSGRKWLSLLLVLCMVLTMLPAMSVPAAAADFNSNQTIGEQTISTDTTWNIPAGVTVSVQGQITISSGATLTLTGGGTIQRAAEYTTGPLFAVGGTLTATGVVMDGQNIAADYAAIFTQNTGSKIVLNNVTLQNFKSSGSKGGALCMGNGGEATLTNCTIQNNSATSYGGAIYAGDNVALSITGGTISTNQTTNTFSTYGGGALYIRTAVVSLNNVTFSQNTSTRGGAIYNSSYGTLTITGGSISGNTATESEYENSAGIYHSSRESGGGVLNLNGDVRISDPIYLDSKNASKVVILQSALQYPLTLYCADAGEGRVVIEGDTNYTVTAQDMARLSMKNNGWYFGLSGKNNQIFLTALESEAYIPIIIQSDDDSLNVTLKQNGQTVALDYSETAGGYIGSVPAGTYDVYVDGTDTGNNITVSVNNTVFGPEVLMHHSHPICGDSSCQEHGGAVSFYALTSLNSTLTQGNYYLTSDLINNTGNDIAISGAVNLCLNGQTLNLNGHHIKIEGSGNSLTLCDCGTTGEITGGSGEHGGAIYVNGGTLTLYSGTITGNTANGNGGGVYVLNGSFTMSGGSITDNTANQGGGVLVENSTFTMTGGSISDNIATQAESGGGGIFVTGASSSFTMSGSSSISNNMASGRASRGGGIYLPSGTFTMSDNASVTNNTASNGGGVFTDGTFTMTGGTITGNTAISNGGGVYVYTNGSFSISGAPTVTNNTRSSDNTGNNVLLLKNKTIGITNPLTSGKIGVTMETLGVFTSGWGDHMGNDAPNEYFTSDSGTYLVMLNNDSSEVMLHKHSYTYSGSGGDTVITETCAGCGHSATAAISIRDDADLTYTGSAITPAQVTYSDDWQGGDLTITYSNNTNVGTATATITKDNATASVTFMIGKANQTLPTASEYSIDYFNEKITSIASGCKVYTAQDASTEVAAGSPISNYLGGNLYIRWEETDNYHASGWTTIPLTPRPDAPSVTAVAESIKGKGDGRATGVTTAMEYSTDNGQNWTPCTGAEITDLAAGTTVTIRVKATATTPHGETASCTIDASENTLTVTFEENGGSAVTDITGLSYNAAISAPTEPTKTGYTFAGWYREAACTTLWDFSSDKVTDDITLYAKWTPAAYSITYHLDGGTADGNPETYTVETDSFTLNNPTRTGYTFAGWTGTGLDEATESVTIERGSTGDRTYTATWTANTYTVAFDKNAGDATGEMTAQTFAYGQKQALTANTYTRTGYTFSGWNTEADGSGVKYTDQQEVENLSATDGATITLYAQWALEGLTVTITGVPEEPVTYGTEITLTAATTHTADGLTYTYQWYKGDAALSGKTESTLTLTDVADSGSYTVKVTASDGSQSSMASSTPVEVAVRPLGIAVTWSGLTQVYGDKEPEVSAVLGGVLGNDACALSAITYQQGDTSVAEPTNAGEYKAKVSLTGADAANYILKNGTATLTIRPKAVGFTVSGNAVKGDGTAKAATITPTDNTLTQTGYTVTYRQGTVTVAAPTAVGSYEIWVEITGGNYQHTNGKTEMQVGSLTITQAPPVLYTVTFAGGADAAGTAPNALSAVANAKIILPESNFTRTNYQFTGWAYGGKTYQPGDSFTMPARDVTFTAQWQQTYGITITVQEPEGEDMQPVSDAVVSLWLGANKLNELHTGSDGTYIFTDLLPGIYNLVVTKGDRIVTSMVEITTENVKQDADLPKGATNSIVEVTEGSPDIVVGNLNTVFQQQPDDTVYTEADQATVIGGGKVEFTFKADEKQKTEVSEDLRKIQTVSGESNLALVMDYKLEKEVFDAEGKKIDEDSKTIPLSNVLLEIRLPLPTELQGKAGYAVYRVHNDQAEAMKANPGSGEEGFKVEGSYITIYAQKFSTYAIGYTESSGNNNNNNQSSGGGGSSTPTYPPSIEEPEHGSVTISPKNPEKGDQVTITPTPDEGYTVDTVIVTDPNGKPVAVTPNDDGTYTFVQPTGKVTITVTFRKLTSVSDCPRDESCPMAPFTDADRNAWYHDGIHYCVEHGLMMGTSQTTFAPDIVTTRGMIVTILWRLEGSPIVGASLDYDDVKAEDWCGEAVRWADSVGVVTGYGNGKFGPNDTITREQMTAMLWRYTGSPSVSNDLSGYTDAGTVSSYAQQAMAWCVEQGIIGGTTTTTLSPQGPATRAQVATILMRFCEECK